MAKGDRSVVTKRPDDKVTLGQVQALIYAAFENAPKDEEFVRRIWQTLSKLSVEENARTKATARQWWRFW